MVGGGSGASMGIVAGAAVGGLVLVILLIVVVRRRHHRGDQPKGRDRGATPAATSSEGSLTAMQHRYQVGVVRVL